MVTILFFLVSFLMCWLGFVFFPKTSKLNAVVSFMLGYMTTLCYGAAGALVLQVCHVGITLESVGVIYLLMAIVLWGYVIWKRSVQRLEVRKIDFLGLLVGALIVGGVALHIFTVYLHANYHNSIDPSSHFYMAMQTVRNHGISGMYFSQFHNAMLMNILLHFLPEVWCYKAFIISDCFQTLMQYYFVYAFMIYLFRNHKKKYLPILITLLYWLGYPLYSFAGGGYVYWAMGATLVIYVFWLLKIYEEHKALRKKCLALVLLGCFSIVVCYVQFAPAAVLAAILVILYCSFSENHFVVSKKGMMQLGAVGAVGLLLGALSYYFIFYRHGLDVFESLRGGSNTSKSLELIVFIPVLYYIIYTRAKTKKWNAYVWSMLSVCFVQLALALLSAMNMVSSYYLFKSNFILWFLAFVVCIDGYQCIEDKMRGYFRHYLAVVSIFLLMTYVPKNQLESDDAFSLDNSIYRHNALLFQVEDYRDSFAASNMDLIEYIASNYDYATEKVALIGTNEITGARGWYTGVTGQYKYYIKSPLEQEGIENYLQNNEVDYIVVFYDSEAYEVQKEFLESFEKVYDSEEGFISRVR